MKVGIIGLLRNNFSVTHYTNKEIWQWCFAEQPDDTDRNLSPLLAVNLRPSRPVKAKRDTSLPSHVREARVMATQHTTVIVESNPYDRDRWFKIDFSDYLFLVKPTEETVLRTHLGAILTEERYTSMIYVKGMFVEVRNDTPELRYGVDFSKAALDRDRRSMMSNSDVTHTLAEIWNILITEDHPTAVERYLDVLLMQNDWLETIKARQHINQSSAKKLFTALCLRYPDSFFYSSEDPCVSEVRLSFIYF